MKYLKKTAILITVFFLAGCDLFSSLRSKKLDVKDTSIPLTSGSLIYTVSGSGALNWKFEVFFDSNHSFVKRKFAMGTKRNSILDKKNDEILNLHREFPAKKFVIFSNQKELIHQEMSTTYGKPILTETEETKEIMGYKCKKIIVKHGSQVEEIFWVTSN